MRVEYTLRKPLTILLVSILVVISTMPTVSWARTEARYELIAGDVFFGNDLGQWVTKQSLFHQNTLQTEDLEHLNIDFPIKADDLGLGPTIGTAEADGVALTGSANVLPFGPVNLAFPDVHQDAFQSIAATQTGFFTANTVGIPPANLGSYELISGPGAFLSPVSAPSSIAGPYMPYAEMTNIIPGYERQKAIIKKKSNLADQEFVWPYSIPTAKAASGSLALDTSSLSSPGYVPDVPSLEGVKSVNPNAGSVLKSQVRDPTGAAGISRQEVTGVEGVVPGSYMGGGAQNYLAYPFFPFAAKAEQISQMSLLDRMWRNAHLGTMGRAYEGLTAYPTWILPLDYTKSAINMADWAAVNREALKYTLPGTHIMPRLWDINIVPGA
ncbi:hypothetical protein MCP_1206 [Methanocella paludicola SANAE]|uniref:Uncharacterized protein n=1 Tax=Methanocella paludicola (strain DSM 17711 / JCM 13418 / NBRC 101707 / SANAE) TaxID=304371 RepID=D1YXV6_METPS|nr:hypothetical protein [Methanocella paludicola]BAI61278.1 hypothetical protein MCP_1206 [Methanocella paludicola SANAE]